MGYLKMRFVRISKSKIKVIITKDECIEHKITATDGEYDNTQLRECLSEVFKELKSNADFDFGSEKVLIQLYPTEEGGCEMYVTILSYLSGKDKSALLSADNLNTYERRRCQYRFSSLEEVCRALRQINRSGIDSDLFYGDGGYYLSLFDDVVDGEEELGFLTEYAERTSMLPRAYMVEHYLPLALGNAIDVFRNM